MPPPLMKPYEPSQLVTSEEGRVDTLIHEVFLAGREPEAFTVIRRGRHWILARQIPPLLHDKPVSMECLRLTPLEPRIFGLSLRRHDGRWTRLPVKGNLTTLSQFVQRHLPHWI